MGSEAAQKRLLDGLGVETPPAAGNASGPNYLPESPSTLSVECKAVLFVLLQQVCWPNMEIYCVHVYLFYKIHP